MRATVAKKLKRIAQRETIGKKNKLYLEINKINRIDKKGKIVGRTHTKILHRDCTRWLYQKLKNQYKLRKAV